MHFSLFQRTRKNAIRKSRHNEFVSLHRAKSYAIRICTAQPLPLCICTAHAQKLLSARARCLPLLSRAKFGKCLARVAVGSNPQRPPEPHPTRLKHDCVASMMSRALLTAWVASRKNANRSSVYHKAEI